MAKRKIKDGVTDLEYFFIPLLVPGTWVVMLVRGPEASYEPLLSSVYAVVGYPLPL